SPRLEPAPFAGVAVVRAAPGALADQPGAASIAPQPRPAALAPQHGLRAGGLGPPVRPALPAGGPPAGGPWPGRPRPGRVSLGPRPLLGAGAPRLAADHGSSCRSTALSTRRPLGVTRSDKASSTTKPSASSVLRRRASTACSSSRPATARKARRDTPSVV